MHNNFANLPHYMPKVVGYLTERLNAITHSCCPIRTFRAISEGIAFWVNTGHAEWKASETKFRFFKMTDAGFFKVWISKYVKVLVL